MNLRSDLKTATDSKLFCKNLSLRKEETIFCYTKKKKKEKKKKNYRREFDQLEFVKNVSSVFRCFPPHCMVSQYVFKILIYFRLC